MNNNNDFFFWLGADGELESVTENEFNEKQEQVREQKRKWLNVEIEDGTDEQDIGG